MECRATGTRKEACVSPGGGRVWAPVFHFSARNVVALPTAGSALAADVTSQIDALVFVSATAVLCVSWRSLFIPASASTYGQLSLCVSFSLCVSWPPPLPPSPPSPLTGLYFLYECLQYLMEAKKAQQSLESTYKQLDSVSTPSDPPFCACRCFWKRFWWNVEIHIAAPEFHRRKEFPPEPMKRNLVKKKKEQQKKRVRVRLD